MPEWLQVLLGVLLLWDASFVVAVVLRFALRHAGREALDRHWPGGQGGSGGSST